jgi:SAM-dependent methyltransferase
MRWNELKEWAMVDIQNPSIRVPAMYLNFFCSHLRSLAQRKRPMEFEALFWKHKYYGYSQSAVPDWWDPDCWRSCHSEMMKGLLDELTERFGEDLLLIDVGSGAVTSYVGKLDISRYNITTVDPLADLYNSLNCEYLPEYPLSCKNGTGESLGRVFDANTFHLCLTQNAIDHSENPRDFVRNLFKVCKPGGFIYLSGFLREGEAAGYWGLHQHDLYVKDNNLFWTNRRESIKKLNLTGSLDMECYDLDLEGKKPGDKFTLIFRKND